jgi:hypothetical protein
MKTKKSGVFAALAVVLLLGAALITNCMNPLGSGGLTASKEKPTFKVPDGKSLFRLDFGGSNGRTIMPSTGLGDFKAFEVIIANKNTTDPADYDPPETFIFSGTSELPVTDADFFLADLATHSFLATLGETYAITVNAYLSWTSGGSNVVAATGDNGASGTFIEPGPNEADIALGVIDNNGSGTLSWALTYDDDADFTGLVSATLSITTLGGVVQGTDTNLQALAANATGSRSIPSGYYYAIVSLTKANSVPVVYKDVVHIYRGMESELIKSFSELVTLPTYTVTFRRPAAGNTDAVTSTATYTHGQIITAGTGYSGLPTEETTNDPVEPGDFLGWWTATGGTGTKVAVTSKVLFTRTLFGHWVAPAGPPTLTVAITFTLEEGDASLSLDKTTVSKATLEGGTSVVITVTTTLSNPSILVGEHTVTGTTITIAFGGTPDLDDLLVVGAEIPLTVQGYSDGQLYTKTFTIEIE